MLVICFFDFGCKRPCEKKSFYEPFNDKLFPVYSYHNGLDTLTFLNTFVGDTFTFFVGKKNSIYDDPEFLPEQDCYTYYAEAVSYIMKNKLNSLDSILVNIKSYANSNYHTETAINYRGVVFFDINFYSYTTYNLKFSYNTFTYKNLTRITQHKNDTSCYVLYNDDFGITRLHKDNEYDLILIKK